MRRLICVGAFLLSLSGCSQFEMGQITKQDASLSVNDILGRCSEVYQQAETLHVRGVLRDERKPERNVSPIGWDFAKPGRCRLQIGMDLALVGADDWWTYDGDTKRFRSHLRSDDVPIAKAASWLSKGILFVLPGLLADGGGAFQRDAAWNLEGFAWATERPCYVISRHDPSRGRLKVWIDQDSFVIRSWAWDRLSANGIEERMASCIYSDVAVNAELSPDSFQAQRPNPIALTRGALGSLESGAKESDGVMQVAAKGSAHRF